MSRRHSSRYNAFPVEPPVAAPVAAPPPAASPFQGILSALMPGKSDAPVASPLSGILSSLVPGKPAAPAVYKMPPLPVGELMGGVSNTVRGLVLNDNWWLLLLIIFLFFPKMSSRMFGGLIKD